jgi:hypothetical protein
VARLGAGQSRLRIAIKVKDVISYKMSSKTLGSTQLGLSPHEVQYLGCDINHSPQTNAKVTNARSCTSTPLCPLIACIWTTLPFTRHGNNTHRMCWFDLYKRRGLLLGGPLCCTLNGVSGHSDSSGSCRCGYCQLWLYQDTRGWSRKVLRRLGRFKQLDVLSGSLLGGRYLKRRLYSSCCCRVAWPQNCPLKVLYTYKTLPKY